MDTKNRFSFHISKTGASHLPKGMPCQDYSLSWESEDANNLIIIVCDGHGSSTYVRSDVGSRLAAEITKSKLIEFIKETDPSLFLYKAGAVTARPSLDESLWDVPLTTALSSMTEVEMRQLKQNQLFCQQVKEIREQDFVICRLFEQIYTEWLDAINKDSIENPFSETEKSALGQKDLVKAYGTTLMAYMQTPFYWLSFHIGDGRVVAADRSLEWHQPVPWDCNCFQNYTTSLCNKNALLYFRYAFNGNGEFPVSVMCCSDGVEDSYGDFDVAPQYLLNFYNGLLNAIMEDGSDNFMIKLDEYLPKLSAAGSKDDMSLAGFVCLDAIVDGLSRWKFICQRDRLNTEHDKRIKQQKKLNDELSKLRMEQDELNNKLSCTEQTTIEKIQKMFVQIEKILAGNIEEIKGYQSRIKTHVDEIETMVDSINKELDSNKSEDEKARTEKGTLRQSFNELEAKIEEQKQSDNKAWQEFIAAHQGKNDGIGVIESDSLNVETF